GFFSDWDGAASSVPWEGEDSWDSPAFESSATRGPGSWAPAETPAAKTKSQANRATITRAIPYHPLLGADRPGTFPGLGQATSNTPVSFSVDPYLFSRPSHVRNMRRSTRW